jgi:hypothetical protein
MKGSQRRETQESSACEKTSLYSIGLRTRIAAQTKCFPNLKTLSPQTMCVPLHLLAISSSKNLYGLQICVGRRVTENSQHRDNLAFVVKCMSYDVQ